MKGRNWLYWVALLLLLLFLNSCQPQIPDVSEEPAATVAADTLPPSSIGSESSHLVRPTPANPQEKVEPTRAISAETIPQANPGPQTNSPGQDEPVHRNSHHLYLMVILRR